MKYHHYITSFLFGVVTLMSLIMMPDTAKTQTKDNLELTLFNVYNLQGNYLSHFGSVSYTNNLKLYGNNLGFTLNYKRLLYGHTYFKIGMGYMEFAVDKIENKSGNPSVLYDSRPINYPNPLYLLYSTTKYHYNTLLYVLGIERQFNISNTLVFFAGLDYFYASSLSQKYYIPKIQTYYHTANEKGLGSLVNVNIGIGKKFGNFSLLPALVIPVYKIWKQDIVFYENPNSNISNWGNGIGIRLSVSYR